MDRLGRIVSVVAIVLTLSTLARSSHLPVQKRQVSNGLSTDSQCVLNCVSLHSHSWGSVSRVIVGQLPIIDSASSNFSTTAVPITTTASSSDGPSGYFQQICQINDQFATCMRKCDITSDSSSSSATTTVAPGSLLMADLCSPDNKNVQSSSTCLSENRKQIETHCGSTVTSFYAASAGLDKILNKSTEWAIANVNAQVGELCRAADSQLSCFGRTIGLVCPGSENVLAQLVRSVTDQIGSMISAAQTNAKPKECHMLLQKFSNNNNGTNRSFASTNAELSDNTNDDQGHFPNVRDVGVTTTVASGGSRLVISADKALFLVFTGVLSMFVASVL